MKKPPELNANEVNQVLRKHGYKLPPNCLPLRMISAWHFGKYYGYGTKDGWTPLNSSGGIATKAFHDHSVRFSAKINTALQNLLKERNRENIKRN